MGLVQSLVPLAKPAKLATPIGALSGKSVQVSLPAVVSITAVGPPEAAAGLAWDHNVSEDRKMTETRIKHLRMGASLSVISPNLELYDSNGGIYLSDGTFRACIS